ncbi:MAG: hypothetical protein ACTSRS_14375 [Candidatus Helarchaeota archaeon]
MERETWFKISSWGAVIVGLLVIVGAFDPYIGIYGEFYTYLILIAGIIGVIGAILSLGILPLLGGLIIIIGMLILTIQNELSISILETLLRAIFFTIFGGGIILSFEMPEDPLSIELSRLQIGKTHYYELKAIGITNLKKLVEERGHEKEVCSLTSIELPQLKSWIVKAEKILQEVNELKRRELIKSSKKG